ncbi:MAG: hypothetical protein KAX99_02300 [Azonexus sp.]|jgi:hypothetical protein|nr:hypothetical protein [Azonexus sp.]
MTRQERNDLIENRSEMAKTVLNMLLWSMDDDCPLAEGEVHKAIAAAIELLSVPEVAA